MAPRNMPRAAASRARALFDASSSGLSELEHDPTPTVGTERVRGGFQAGPYRNPLLLVDTVARSGTNHPADVPGHRSRLCLGFPSPLGKPDKTPVGGDF
jgi:hypothetical protein